MIKNKSNCLDNKCLTNKIVYKAEIENNHGINELSTKVYFAISKIELKSRYNNHTMSFRDWTHENNAKLSKYIWSLKDQNKDFDIKWSIFKTIFRNNDIVNLYLLENLLICNFNEKDRLLKKQLDLVFKGRHANKNQ